MAKVWIPSQMLSLAGGREQVSVEGRTVREVIANLNRAHNGFRDRLCRDDKLKPTIAVVVDGEISSLGMRQKVSLESEVQFLPAMSGG